VAEAAPRLPRMAGHGDATYSGSMATPQSRSAGHGRSVPGAGIGLRSPHYTAFLESRPTLPLVEVHSENFFRGGRHLDVLMQVRRDTPVSLHGVGLSLGSTDPLSERHVAALKSLADRVEPSLVSDHLCWSSVAGVYVNDLLPLPYTHEALVHVAQRVERVQEALGRRLLVENVSSYLEFDGADMPEWTFLAELARRTGCALLLDVNNIYVSARNHGFDALTYLAAIPPESVAEMHLAGYSVNRVPLDGGGDAELLIDTHSRPVAEPVWALYEQALQHIGARPTIVEWDADLPPLDALLDEAANAERRMDAHGHAA
jgi:uncharacterized protein (UPF0276 family)